MYKNQTAQRGYTIVEMIIVIVIIAILSTIVYVSYNGVQANGRDAERVSDTLSVKSQLETYFNESGTYPLESTMTSSTVSTIAGGGGILKGLDAAALVNPLAASDETNSYDEISVGSTPPNDEYWYQAYESDGSTVCIEVPCAKFKIMYTKESDGTTDTLSSIN